MRLIDASVAVKFALDEPDHMTARELAGEPLQAPELILSEVANAWWKAWRRGALSVEGYETAVANLPGVFDHLGSSEPLMPRAAELSREIDHPVYDCVYLALAEQAGEQLITADAKLLRKLASTSFARLARPLD